MTGQEKGDKKKNINHKGPDFLVFSLLRAPYSHLGGKNS
jgi:hypothetical protein